MKLCLVSTAIACALCVLPAAARESSAQIAAACQLSIKNAATSGDIPPVGSAEANELYLDCWEGAVQSRDGVAPNIRKICKEELDRRGIRSGTSQWDQANRQCADRERARSAPVLAAVNVCLKELRPKAAMFGSADWDNAYEACMSRSGVDRTTALAAAEPKPFGRGKVQAYLNALYHNDLPTLRAIDDEYARINRRGNKYMEGLELSLLHRILNNYFIHYPIAFKDCLNPNSPKITYVTFEGGVEIGRRDIPIARHLYPLARRTGASGGASWIEEAFVDVAGLEEMRSRNVSEVIAETMNGLKCTDPVVRQLEQGFLKYAPMLMPKRFANQ